MTRQEFLNARLKMYVEAESAVLAGQEYTIGERRLRRADLSIIRKAIDDLIADGATLFDDKPRFSRIKRAVFV